MLIAATSLVRMTNPFVFAYVLAMAACSAVGVVVLSGALLLALWPRARQSALRLAGRVIGLFPFMLFFQCLSLPLLV